MRRQPRTNEQRTRESRERVLEAALRLFSRQGFRSTTLREIADEAGVSTGNVYHHFSDKEEMFDTLLDDYWKILAKPDYPFNAALAAGAFPDDLEALGQAARESVRLYRPYVALIYVDVVEFEGLHIRKFYSEMPGRFARFLKKHGREEEIKRRLRPGISPVSAVMLATRIYLNYFAVEILFGVPNHFGKSSTAVVHEIAEMLRNGILRTGEVAAAPRPRAVSR